jgi:hypothetical protein
MVIRGLFKITVLHLCLIFTISSCGVTDHEDEQYRSEMGSTGIMQQHELLSYNQVEEENKDSTGVKDDEIILSSCPTCFEDPGDGTGGGSSCTPSNEYMISATYQNTTLSQGVSGSTASQITSHIRPFWVNIIQEAESVLEESPQPATFFWQEFPFHSYFEIDKKALFTTTYQSTGNISFALDLSNMFAKLYYSKVAGAALYNLKVEVTSDGFESHGNYNISQDNFIFTDFSFDNLNVDINAGWVAGLADALVCFFTVFQQCNTISGAERSVEEAIVDQVETMLAAVNDNPNQLIHSLIHIPQVTNALPLIDQALAELIQSNVHAAMEIAMPACGDITRDGTIHLTVTTN